jgi:hypothetical protein
MSDAMKLIVEGCVKLRAARFQLQPHDRGGGLPFDKRMPSSPPLRTWLGKFLARAFGILAPAHTMILRNRSARLQEHDRMPGTDGFIGRTLLGIALVKRIEPSDYDHLIVACLPHDIGYMRGVLSGETETKFVVDARGGKVACHVDRRTRPPRHSHEGHPPDAQTGVRGYPMAFGPSCR